MIQVENAPTGVTTIVVRFYSRGSSTVVTGPHTLVEGRSGSYSYQPTTTELPDDGVYDAVVDDDGAFIASRLYFWQDGAEVTDGALNTLSKAIQTLITNTVAKTTELSALATAANVTAAQTAIIDRGDIAWITGSGGGGTVDLTGIATTAQLNAVQAAILAEGVNWETADLTPVAKTTSLANLATSANVAAVQTAILAEGANWETADLTGIARTTDLSSLATAANVTAAQTAIINEGANWETADLTGVAKTAELTGFATPAQVQAVQTAILAEGANWETADLTGVALASQFTGLATATQVANSQAAIINRGDAAWITATITGGGTGGTVDLSPVTAAIADVKTDVGTAISDIADVQTTVDALPTTVTPATNLTPVTTALTNLQTSVNALPTTVTPATDLTPVTTAVANVQAAVDAIDTSNLSTFDPANQTVNVAAVGGTTITSLDQFKADISGLSTQVGTISTTLASAQFGLTMQQATQLAAIPTNNPLSAIEQAVAAGAQIVIDHGDQPGNWTGLAGTGTDGNSLSVSGIAQAVSTELNPVLTTIAADAAIARKAETNLATKNRTTAVTTVLDDDETSSLFAFRTVGADGQPDVNTPTRREPVAV